MSVRRGALARPDRPAAILAFSFPPATAARGRRIRGLEAVSSYCHGR